MSKKEENKKDYKQQVYDLLDNYVDGREIFIKAKDAQTWNYPVTLKDGVEPDPDLPTSWIELVDRVFAIIAKEKYDLDTYPNTIEIITAEQMIHQYTSVGLPVNYEHWSIGKRLMQHEQEYSQTKSLAFEIVINSDPAIAYCMENNSPLMQMLVIAHASYGHNNFFKQNYMFQEYTDASDIIPLSRDLREFLIECEKRFGVDEVERLLDSCHALQSHSVSGDHFRRSSETRRRDADADTDIFSGVNLKDQFNRFADKPGKPIDCGMEQNILGFMADNAPHLPEWKRKVMRMVSEVATYFHPQKQTQVMNEGWASFWHYQLIHDAEELGLMDAGMMMEFYDSHNAVVKQQSLYWRNPQTGEVEQNPYYGGINPYALGFRMFHDIKRISEDPTEEDKKWFPYIAGKGDWLEVIKDARDNFKDESFIEQYLSPKLMRDFKFFAIEDDADAQFVEVTGIHDKDGYENVRNTLSESYRLDEKMPVLGVAEYYDRKDRRLVIKHMMSNGKPLQEKHMNEVVKHMHRLWEHPVIVESIDEDGDVVEEFRCPVSVTASPVRGNVSTPRHRVAH